MLELFAEHVPVAPSAPEYAETRPRPRPRRERSVPIGRMVAGGGLAAGLVYLVMQQLRQESEMEYVEVVDLEPATADVYAEADEFDDVDATLSGAYAGGMPYREGGPEYTAASTGYLGSDGGGFDDPLRTPDDATLADYAATDVRGGTGAGAGTPGYGTTGTGTGTGGGAYGTGTGGTGGYGATGTGTGGYGAAGSGGFGDSGGSATNPPA